MTWPRRVTGAAVLLLAVALSDRMAADTLVSGTISTSTTWTLANSPYVVTGDVYVEFNGTPTPVLTIQPGVTVKFNANTSLFIGNGYPGELQAVGTSMSPITFTANGSTAPGYWRGLRVFSHSTSASQIAYATISYAGQSGVNAALAMYLSNASIQNVTIQNNQHAGIGITGGAPTISGVTASGNPWGIIFWAGGSASVSNATITGNSSGGLFFGGTPPPSASLQNLTITNNTGFAISQDPWNTLGTVSGLMASGNGTNGIEIRGSSSGAVSATWKSCGLPYVITGDIYVQGSGTPVLTIAAGVTVKFNANTTLYIGTNNYAAGLQAVGTAASPIVFTANSANPTAGFWRGIRMDAATLSSSQIGYATVSYGGLNGSWGGIYVNGCSPTISNVTVTNNAHSGITVNGGSGSITSVTAGRGNPTGMVFFGNYTGTVSSSTVSGNGGIGIWIASPAKPFLQTVSITGNSGFAISQDPWVTLGTTSGLTASGNGTNGIEIRGSGSGVVSATWIKTGLPYVVTGDVSVQGAGNPVLTISPGVTVKFNANVTLYIASNNYVAGLQAVGTAASPITFTANSTSPTAGFWRGINIARPALSSSRIAYATISYGGLGNTWGGVHIAAASLATLDHVTLSSNVYAGVSLNNSTTRIFNCNFTGNTAGIVNQTSTAVDARLNWWGSSTGPSGAGTGTGQWVSPGIRVEPWLGTASSSPQWVSSFSLGNRTFNPTLAINANFSVNTTVAGTWTVKFFNSSSALVRTLSGSGSVISASWDGKNDSGVAQPNGSYTYQVDSVASGNSAAPAVGGTVIDTTKALTLTSVSATPAYFSPNGDGVQDTVAIGATSSFDGASWTLTIRNSGGTTVRTASGPATPNVAYTWDGKDGAGTVQPDGAYTLQIILTDGSASTNATPTATLDRTAPTASITNPASGTLSNVYQNGNADFSVIGTGTDANLQNWVVDYGSGSAPTSWMTVATGTSPVSAAAFGTWSTIGLTNGTYTLRLQVWDLAGNRSAKTQVETVDNLKVSQNVLQFNGSTGGTVQYTSTVPFSLTETMVIKNQAGQTIRNLVNTSRAAGSYTDSWNGRNDAGVIQPDGAYFYIATATAGTSTMTWDLTNQYLNDYSPWINQTYTVSLPFAPFNNAPLALSWNFGQAARMWILYVRNGSVLDLSNPTAPTPADCATPGNWCFPAGEYEESGAHTDSWAGLDPTGAFRQDIKGIGALARRDTFSKNAVILFGTKPTLTGLNVQPALYNPSRGTQTLAFDNTTYQSQSAAITITFTSQSSSSVLRTMTLNPSTPGHVTVTWDGKADNGLWVAPGYYTVTVTLRDTVGNVMTRRILTTVFY